MSQRRRRQVAWLCGVGLLAAWLAAAFQATRVAPAPPAGAVAASADLGGDPTLPPVAIARLAGVRERLAHAPAPHQPLRNPFEFVSSPARTDGPASDPEAAAALPEPVAAWSRAPVVPSLIGIAEQHGPEGAERTAVLSSDGEVWLVGPGDRVLTQFRVVEVDASSIVLEEIATARTLRLELP